MAGDNKDRIGAVATGLILVGALNLAVFIFASTGDSNDWGKQLVALGCLVLSPLLYMAGLMCTGHALKAKQHIFPSVAGMILGVSPIAWFLLAGILKP